jgi:prepilin-type N-terminal cleavage/methylation domain-containing protein
MNQRNAMNDRKSQEGFTLLELTIVLVVSALLLVPLLKLTLESIGSSREQLTETALEAATDVLVAYAATNKGCLPFAADSEGGLVNTSITGAPLTDTGIGVTDQHAGDLPWSELGLTNSFLDGDHMRIQYYVATPYAGSDCPAGFRGFEYHSNIDYVGGSEAGEEVYVYYGEGNDRALYEITGTYAAGKVPPNSAKSDPIDDVTDLLPEFLLEVRRGPDVTGSGNADDVLSAQNVFVLIAVGENRNAGAITLDGGSEVIGPRTYVRDGDHAGNDAGDTWVLGTTDVDEVVFSNTTSIDLNDSNNDGDDVLRVVSFFEYKAKLRKFGLNMEPMCVNSC